MMKQTFLYVALGMSLMLGMALGTSAQLSLSMEQAQALGVQHAYDMQRARIDVEVAKRDVKELLATGLPQVNASVDLNHFFDLPVSVVPAQEFNEFAPKDSVIELAFGTTQSATAGLNATQLIFSGSYLVGVKAAKVLADAKALSVESTELETRKAVADAYATALAAQANVATLEKAVVLIAGTEEELRALAQEGLVEAVDADQMQLSRQNVQQQLNTARLQADLTKKLLLFQCGLDVNKEVELTDNLIDLTREAVPASLLGGMDLALNPRLEEQRQYVALAELDVMNKRAEGLPQVAAFFSSNAQAFRDPELPILKEEAEWYPNQLVGLSINMPIWTSFGGRQRVEKAKLAVLTAESGLAQMESAARLEFDNAKASFLDAQAALGNAEEQRDLASRILTRIELGHKEGVRSSFELNTAQNQLLEAEGNLIGAQLAWLNAQQRLIASNPQP